VVCEQMSVQFSLQAGTAEWEMQHQVGRYLSSQLYQSWWEAGGAALLGWEDVTLHPGPGQEVRLQGQFYTFRPKPGQQLVGRVHSKKADYLEIIVLGMFYARIDCTAETALLYVKVGQPFRFKVRTVSLDTGRPSLAGEPVKGSLEVEEDPSGLFDVVEYSHEEGDVNANGEVEYGGKLKRKKVTLSSEIERKNPKKNSLLEKSQSNEAGEMVIKLMMVVSGSVYAEVNFRLKQTTPMGKLMKVYSESVGVPIHSLRFLGADVGRINNSDTPEDLKMEQDDVIEVFLSSSYTELMSIVLFDRSPSRLQLQLFKESDMDREEGGETALDMAVRRNNHAAALLLVYKGAKAFVADVSKYRELVELVRHSRSIEFLSLLSRLPGPSLTRPELVELAELFDEGELWSHLTSHPHLLA